MAAAITGQGCVTVAIQLHVPFTAGRIPPICVRAVTPVSMQQVWWLLITSVCGFARPANVLLQPFFARQMLPHFVPPAMLTSILPTSWHIVTTVSQLFPFQVATILFTENIYTPPRTLKLWACGFSSHFVVAYCYFYSSPFTFHSTSCVYRISAQVQ